MKTYRYRIFNLTIESTLECPDLIPGDYLNPDVTLRRGKVPDALTDAVVRTDYYQASDNQFLLNIENVAKYLITNGKQILIDKYPEGNEDSVMVFLLGSAMGALLHQRGMLPLHASAIEFRGKSIAFIGPSGIGKSTLAGAFQARNYRVLADDLCVITFDHAGLPTVLPGNPNLKLWSDSVIFLGKDVSDFRRVQSDINKHKIPLLNSFCDTPVLLERIYLLENSVNGQLSLESIQGERKLTILLENTYRSNYLLVNESILPYLKQCVEVAKKIGLKKVIRPETFTSQDAFVKLIESDLKSETS